MLGYRQVQVLAVEAASNQPRWQEFRAEPPFLTQLNHEVCKVFPIELGAWGVPHVESLEEGGIQILVKERYPTSLQLKRVTELY